LGPENYISGNPHFVKSALSRYNQWDFLAMVDAYKIHYEERDYGQLFCRQSSKDIVNMLVTEAEKAGVEIRLNTKIQRVYKNQRFFVQTDAGELAAESLVIATGGIAWQSAGATDFGYRIAAKFGLDIIRPAAGLVALQFSKKQQKRWGQLSGISVNAVIKYHNVSFRDELLFTHKGISGPAVLQISNYWQKEDRIFVDFLPDINLVKILAESAGRQTLKNFLSDYLPERLVKFLIAGKIEDKPVYQYNEKEIERIDKILHHYPINPFTKASIKKAEVTLGGIDTNEVSSRTFEANKVKNLYFIGEVLDVTGQLGGYNLQWAWSSGYCAGQFV
jgi:predicted Rossmann fold flavoprotein